MGFSDIRRPLVIAHRGFRAKYPENTLAAFRAAADAGAPMIELDVSLTKDRKLIVIHDDSLDRTTDGAGPVSAVTLSELRQLDAGSWFDARFRNERLPGLEEVLAAMAGRVLVNIEIKSSAFEPHRPPDAIENQVVQLIRERNCRDEVLVSSFSHAVIENIRQLDDRVRIAVISREKSDKKMLAAFKRLDLFSWHPEQSMVVREDVAQMHKAHIAVFPYTVNAPQDADRLFQMDVDGLFTDDPELMMLHLAERGQ